LTLDELIKGLQAYGGMAVAVEGRLEAKGWEPSEVKALVKSQKELASKLASGSKVAIWPRTLYFPDENQISRDQFELFQKMEGGCGRQDYGACKQCAKCKAKDYVNCSHRAGPCFRCSPGSDAFTCTIAVINSAILKLSKVTPLPECGLLYRGLNGMSFPEHLLEMRDSSKMQKDDDIKSFMDSVQGFVEFGFSSATPDKKVAWAYSGAAECKGMKCGSWNAEKGFCEAHRSTILEIQTGQIDRG